MKIERRQFLGTAAASAAGAIVGGNLARAAAAGSTDPTAPVPLGKDLTVSRVGFGTGMRGGNRQTNQTRLGREKFESLLRYNYDRGVRLFDLADLYGSHPYAGRALKQFPRDSYALSTKIWFRKGGIPEGERPSADVCIKRFLKEIGTDYLDLVQLHCTVNHSWPDDLRPYMDAMEELKQKGIIRAHGVSCHSIGALEAAAEEPWVDVVHARINHTGTKMDGPVKEVLPVLKKIHAAGKGVIGMKIIGEGQFRDDDQKREESVRFVTGLDCVDAIVVGFEKPAEVDDLVARVGRALA